MSLLGPVAFVDTHIQPLIMASNPPPLAGTRIIELAGLAPGNPHLTAGPTQGPCHTDNKPRKSPIHFPPPR